MNLLKKIIGAALTAVLCTQVTVTAFAESFADSVNTDVPVISVDDTDTADNTDEVEELPPEQNDPSYWKYKETQSKVGSSAGYDPIHQEQFTSSDKIYGIDVSYYQGNIDWKKVKADGNTYVIIRAGYRGYGNGALVRDAKLYEYLEGADAAGLKVGLYFYTQAINTTEAAEEATFVLNSIKGYTLDLPIYYDIEGVDYDDGRLDMAGLSKTQKTALCTAFCSTIEKGGFKAGVYANYSWLIYSIDGAGLSKNYEIWLANFTDYTSYPNDFTMWQYASTGIVSGITGYVDLDVRYADGNAPTGIPTLTSKQYGQMVTLSWTKVQNATGYYIYSKDSAGNINKVKDTTSTSFSTTVSDKSVTYSVTPYRTVNSKVYVGTTSNAVTVYDTKVYNVTFTDRSVSKIYLAWDKNPNATGYLVYRKKTGSSGSYSLIANVITNSYTATGMTTATGYSFKVTPYFNSDGTTAYSSTKSVLGLESDVADISTKTAQATGLTVTGKTSNSISIKWDKYTATCNGYQVAFYDTSAKKHIAVAYTNDTSYTYTGLTAGKSYNVTVRGYYNYNGAKVPGVFAVYQSVTTEQAAPAAPTGLTVTKQDAGKIYLDWKDVSGATGYQVYRVSGTTYTLAGTITNSACAVTDCKAGTTYKFVVRAYTKNSSGNLYSKYSSAVSVTCIPAVPTNVKVITYTSKYITFGWDKVAGATAYRIYKYNPTKKCYQIYKDVTTNSIQVTGLSQNTGYTFKFKALTGTLKGNATEAITAYSSPPCPSTFKNTAKTSSTISLSWSSVKNGDYYKIYIYDSAKKKYVSYKDVYGTSVKLTGLKSGTTYKFRVATIHKTALRTYTSALSTTILTIKTK